MKKTNIIIGVVVVVIVVILGIVIFTHKGQPAKGHYGADIEDFNPSSGNAQPTLNPTNAPKDTSKTAEPDHSAYSDEFRTRARNDFISSCISRVGQQYKSACTCTADSLAKNYSDLELTKMYFEYRSSNAIPDEIKKAYESCK